MIMSICQLASGLICLYQSLLLTGQLTSAQDSETPPQQSRLQRKYQVWQIYGCRSLDQPVARVLLSASAIYMCDQSSELSTGPAC